ncbi:hypothetical protein DL93DRAFT_1005829 [Clavulina sp. PMI_390]|nr:hypothetical protein DL93DRAFT_1005829 [Clavulina sp. PMI_390]
MGRESPSAVTPAYLAAPIGKGNRKPDLMSVSYQVIQPGDGQHRVQPGDTVSVHYTTSLSDGRVFDTSKLRGSPFRFIVGTGTVVNAWDEGLRSARATRHSRRLDYPLRGRTSRDSQPSLIDDRLKFFFFFSLLVLPCVPTPREKKMRSLSSFSLLVSGSLVPSCRDSSALVFLF